MHAQTLRLTRDFSFAATFVLFIGLFLATQAHAANSAANQAKLDALYNQLLQDPTNIELTLEYAELAVEMGDYEAAIPPLERLLITTPGASKIQLELGILYYLLGSHDVAKTYLNDAKKGGKAPESIIKQADEYLRKM